MNQRQRLGSFIAIGLTISSNSPVALKTQVTKQLFSKQDKEHFNEVNLRMHIADLGPVGWSTNPGPKL